ncbi:head decoration protein [Vineibacter terrae]|uniref:Head decoration protein n=1 Tax=Vineibacter terrae TaxID=2586908 RepID=A0A5C8PGA0_9HYPH|nr:head decoration protein [Vineibacter terrae]TXL72552.1 head decoration protein [Vineibacter terrae]
MVEKTEGKYAGEAIVSEANGARSRDAIVVVSGSGILSAMTVLGRTLVGAAGAAVAFAGNVGNGAMGAITVGGAAKLGVYKLVITEPATNAGSFIVEDPDGKFVGRGNVAAAFNGGGLSFTLADGATDFVAGDGFNITVSGGTVKHTDFDATATDGSQVAVGILYDGVDATAADVRAVAFSRDCEVNKAELVFTGAPDAGQKAQAYADLARAGIIAR